MREAEYFWGDVAGATIQRALANQLAKINRFQFDRFLFIHNANPTPNPTNSRVPILGGNEKPGTTLHAVRIHSSTIFAGGISFSQIRGGVT